MTESGKGKGKGSKKPDNTTPLQPIKPKATLIIFQDPLERKTAITATLKEDGLAVKAESRTVAALDRLGGNLADWLNTRLEPDLNRRRDEESIARHQRQTEAFHLPENVTGSDQDNGFLRRRYEQQVLEDRNRLAITLAAIDDLKREPEPSSEGEVEQIDPDWLNEFASISGRKSNNDLQDLWGRLLAGEIRKPGSFKLNTLQRLSAIDSADAGAIHDFLLHKIAGDVIFKSDVKEVNFTTALYMEELGITVTGSGLMNSTWDIKAGEDFILILVGDVIKVNSAADRQIKLAVWPLTSFGRQMARLIALQRTPSAYLDSVYNALKNQGLTLFRAQLKSCVGEVFECGVWIS